MSQSATHSRRAAALSDEDERALGSREDWWGDPRDDSEQVENSTDTERTDPNDPAEIIAHKLLRETATILCAETYSGEPWNGGRLAEQFAWLDGDHDNFERNHAVHHTNRAIELTDPAVRLGQHDPDSSLVGEWGCERHRKRINAVTGYITGNETTSVLIQDRPLAELMVVIEQWLRGVAARGNSGLTESDVQETLDMARGLKKNTHRNGMRDVDIMAKVVSKVR